MSLTGVSSSSAGVSGVPFVELLDYPVEREAVSTVSSALCRRHRLLPIAREGGTLVVAMVDPDDIVALDDVSAATRLRIRRVAVEAADLQTALDKYHRADDELSDLSTVLSEQSDASDLGQDVPEDDDAPIVRFVNLLISQAVQDRASDIHVEPGEHALRVRYRIDGVLTEVQSVSTSIQAGVISRLKIMAELDIAERRRPQDGRIAVMHSGRKIDLR
ncbi:MAG: type pilus assembly protein PilB, partial [Microbacteriaceae bacterium]|nr:type pilus assembly protein PilB [Microbacteriaceae bacterium]